MKDSAENEMLRYEGKINVPDSERWLSAAAGGLLVVVGLGRKSLMGLLLLATGAYLLYRALTGHCYIYDQLKNYGTSASSLLPANEPPPLSVKRGDEVTESSWESFPTSDPPSWTMGTEKDK